MSVGFLFKDARRARIESGRPVPGELFYGYRELEQAGFDVALIEQADLGVSLHEGPLWKTANRIAGAWTGLHTRAMWQISRPRSLDKLNSHDAIVATQNSLGFALARLRANGRLRARLFFLIMGGLGNDLRSRHGAAHVRRLADTTVLSLSRAETDRLRSEFNLDVRHLPFGVDTGFWTPGEPPAGSEPYILSIGNDPNRDFRRLIDAWEPAFSKLKIVTRRDLGSVPENIDVVRGHFADGDLTDEDIRSLYRGARFVVVPLRNTIQPAGQSVSLQAMACGRAVIVSDIDGMWDRALMVDCETCRMVPPGDTGALNRAIAALIDDPISAQQIGANARRAVENGFDISTTAQTLAGMIAEQVPGFTARKTGNAA